MDGKYIITSDGNFIEANELYHWGILGMKWGVRRYQNADGTLTEAGKKRYNYEADKGDYNQTKADGTRFKQTKKGRTEELKVDATQYAMDDTKALGDTVNSAKNLNNALKETNAESLRRSKNKRPKMDLSNMSDKELRDQINREMLERQYNDLFSPPTKSEKGRQHVDTMLSYAGQVLAVGASAASLAVSIYALRQKRGKG